MCVDCEQVKAVVEEWVGKQGHDQCHYYPDLFRRICEILKVPIDPAIMNLPPRAEFRQGCNKFEGELYDSR
jgi:hypothetical protein